MAHSSVRMHSFPSGRTAVLIFAFLALGAVAATPKSQPNASGSSDQVYPTDQNTIRDIHLLSPGTGWVLRGDHLLWTEDDGGQWNDATPPLESNRSIDTAFFTDANHAWAIIHQTDAYPEHVYIGVTTNGGNAWSVEPLTADKDVLEGYGNQAELSFTDTSHGWALLTETSSAAASRSFLFSTSDGGQQWSRLPEPPVNGRLQFFSPRTGWLCGGVQLNELYVSRDGGQTWAAENLPEPPEVQQARRKGCSLPAFTDANSGIDVEWFQVSESSVRTAPLLQGSATYTTSDGGHTWRLQSTKPATKFGGLGVASICGSTVVTAYYAGHAIITKQDSRAHAARLPFGIDAPRLAIKKAEFVDPQHGWFLAAQDCFRPGCTSISVLLGTDDGGITVRALMGGARPN